ncbi:Gfo/Idh/MocA family protein [Sphingobacterium sp. BIGb0165]|uniref:Gfo/Idh/MocA family protein n=1 Tax=Sphingobacterium sp. BIGb0165 TaxID=2940615 RepID=UPI00216A4015|nr:Gfo/Idh/MocA family oxidoreductase [Sphingobacterium sp. BIGb0165]MCS4227930.1 putative dehydrogenase [Sphingobacterium sp. BIGb0165]
MKILFVGLGAIARKHIKAIRQIEPNAMIYALRRNRLSTTDEGVVNVFDLKEVSEVDFVIISNPTSEHGSTISTLLGLNVPLFIEKPLFHNLNHDKLVQSIVCKGISTYVACNLRFLDSLVFVREFIKGKRINEVNVYCGSYLPNWRPNVDFRKVYSANKEMGGGVHIDLIHEIDYLIWLFGFPKSTKKEFSNVSSLNISAYDYANYLMLYDDFAASVVLNYYRKTPKRSLEVICEEGECSVDLLKNEVRWNDELIFSSKQTITDTYLPQMEFFIENVMQGSKEKGFNDIVEAYNILKICLED